MGAVTFSIDIDLVRAIQKVLPVEVFVETGTFHGDTVASVQDLFEEIYSIELSEELFAENQSRLGKCPHVHLIAGDSTKVLPELAARLRDRGVLFFLDAHGCVAASAIQILSCCPLLEELRAIGCLNPKSLIIIDDARLFLAPPPAPHDIAGWPSFDSILLALQSLSCDHSISVLNDNILFIPRCMESILYRYGREHGVDWLAAMNVFRQHQTSWQELIQKEQEIQKLADDLIGKEVKIQDQAGMLREKEQEIRKLGSLLEELENELNAYRRSLIEKEQVIRTLGRALQAYRITMPWIGSLLSMIRRHYKKFFNLFRPRLGNLCQHPPRPLVFPSSYYKPIKLDSPPGISLVTPSFGQAAFLERTLRSVLDQNYPRLEYFVQDGGSVDGTQEILSRYSDRLTGWESAPDKGQSDAINLGFSKTRGEIMAWLNSDDLLLPGSLACVADFFLRHPAVDVIYGNRLLINEEDLLIGRWILPRHDNRVLSWVDFVPQETLFWRRRVWEKTGGQVNPSFHFAIDWDLLIRFRDAGAVFRRIPRFLGCFRIHSQQKTSAAITHIGFQEMNLIRERIHGKVPSDQEIRKALACYVGRHVLTDLSWRLRRSIGFQR